MILIKRPPPRALRPSPPMALNHRAKKKEEDRRRGVPAVFAAEVFPAKRIMTVFNRGATRKKVRNRRELRRNFEPCEDTLSSRARRGGRFKRVNRPMLRRFIRLIPCHGNNESRGVIMLRRAENIRTTGFSSFPAASSRYGRARG